MKFKIMLICIASFILGIVIWINLPLEIKEYKNIEHGNKIIRNIDEYSKNYNKLPDNADWETFPNASRAN